MTQLFFTKLRLVGVSNVDLPKVGVSRTDRYVMKNVDGLGPPDVDVPITRLRNGRGVPQESMPQLRQIVATIALQPQYQDGITPADLRTEIYGLVTPGYGGAVDVLLMNGDTIVAQTQGRVTKCETAIFSKDPAVVLTINCFESYLAAPGSMLVVPVSKSDPGILNEGTAPSGFAMNIVFTDDVEDFTISDEYENEFMKFDDPFEAGDELFISTVPGDRRVLRTRDAVVTGLYNSLNRESNWLMLHGGNNIFHTTSTDFDWGDVYYTPLYQGV